MTSRKVHLRSVKDSYVAAHFVEMMVKRGLNYSNYDLKNLKRYKAKGSKFTGAKYDYHGIDKYPFYLNKLYYVIEFSLKKDKTAGNKIYMLQDPTTKNIISLHSLQKTNGKKITISIKQIGYYKLIKNKLDDTQNNVSYSFNKIKNYSKGDDC